ncbi:hypothetical protein DSO57_1031723 [Entomophthora muscae]|uniref:Uncharacterized protein n=1 Tax=Entomophthora muscae TaxID=34485 RepID=A0ACC2SDI0_9FUNG|nr:hypothetical protein DSO57_1031723 [Entomophthora muscae]
MVSSSCFDLIYHPRSLGPPVLVSLLYGRGSFSSLLSLGNLPGQAHGLATEGGKVVQSLTSNDLEFPFPRSELVVSPKIFVSKVSPLLEPDHPIATEEFSPPDPAPRRTPWLLGGLVLMGLDSYLPQLSSVSSL